MLSLKHTTARESEKNESTALSHHQAFVGSQRLIANAKTPVSLAIEEKGGNGNRE